MKKRSKKTFYEKVFLKKVFLLGEGFLKKRFVIVKKIPGQRLLEKRVLL